MMKRILALLLSLLMLTGAALAEEAAPAYTLERVVMLSRHNIRSPLSDAGSLLEQLTPHSWYPWTSRGGELSMKGGVCETLMGQYFRKWLAAQGLFEENQVPGEGEVRFYANALQRTVATARYFAAGVFPVANIDVETHAPLGTMDPVFWTKLNFMTADYAEDVFAGIGLLGGAPATAGIQRIHADLQDAIRLVMDVTDIASSEAYQAGTYGDLMQDETVILLEEGQEPRMTGPIKTATSVADALKFQYYEEADAEKAAFGHQLTDDDWRLMHSIVDKYTEMLFTTPLVCVNVAHPLLQELRGEMTAEGRKLSFLCGHDANIASLLAALGAEPYRLPDTVEEQTPIGCKLVFARYLNAQGEAFWAVRMVYQSTEQLRGAETLTLDNPPVWYALTFANAPANEDGLLSEADLLSLFDQALDAYDALVEAYPPDALDDAA